MNYRFPANWILGFLSMVYIFHGQLKSKQLFHGRHKCNILYLTYICLSETLLREGKIASFLKVPRSCWTSANFYKSLLCLWKHTVNQGHVMWHSLCPSLSGKVVPYQTHHLRGWDHMQKTIKYTQWKWLLIHQTMWNRIMRPRHPLNVWDHSGILLPLKSDQQHLDFCIRSSQQ